MSEFKLILETALKLMTPDGLRWVDGDHRKYTSGYQARQKPGYKFYVKIRDSNFWVKDVDVDTAVHSYWRLSRWFEGGGEQTHLSVIRWYLREGSFVSEEV